MRTITLLSLLAAMACSSAAFAGPASVSAPAPALSDGARAPDPSASAGTMLDAEAIAGMQGSYRLSNGDTLKVWAVRSKLFANVGGVKTELVPTSSSEFVARDNNTKLVFKQSPFATDLTLSTSN